MATSIPICDICITHDISTFASGWCLECEEAICSDCEKQHGCMKLTKHHKIISVDNNKMSTSNLESEQECNDHSRKIDFFCLKHSQPCCVTCIFEKHKRCQELKPLPEVEKGMTSFDSSFANLEDRVEDIIESITGLVKEKQENKTRLEVQKNNIITEVQTIRRSINRHFDKVQQSLMEGLEKEEKAQNERIDMCIEKLSVILKKVDKLSSKLEQAKQHKSEFQAFIAAFEWDKTIEKEEKDWISLQTDKISDRVDIELDLSPILMEFEKELTEFGKIEVTYSPSKKLLLENPPNQGQSVTSASSAINKIHLTNICSFQTPPGTSTETLITDIDMLDDGRIILADNSSNRRLVLMSQEGELIKIIQLNDTCFGVAVIDKTTIATTLVKKKKIAIIDIDSSEIQRFISMSEDCYGLSLAGESLVVSLDDPTFQFVNLSGKVVSSVWKADYADYCCVHNNKLYYATSSGDSVFEAKLNGDIVWKSYCQKYDFPDGITTDASGNVFVACKSSKKVLVFGKDGKDFRVLLTKENGLNNPRAIHYKREMNILLVCNLSGQCFLYKVTN
ncbi:E3 ubiquitin-protein ligase TRIM71-like [Mytilus trossulus]|uniref:E3 ubiquitin-protein ligase TRIM71-like n=1 Tax=Mytilus trossulus TaxID=6551 RepID=UPI0030074475